MCDRDRFVLSKGHCSETLYTIFSDKGAYTLDYMVEHFETLETAQFGMHCNHKYCPQIEASTGSLGHGLPIALGMALAARKQKKYWRTYVMTGDGELDEGTNWEAIMAAGHFKLGNLTLIVDKNQLQMTGPTAEVMNIDPLDKKLEAFGWEVVSIDATTCTRAAPPSRRGRRQIPSCAKPYAIISNTTKGQGVDFMAGNVKWHGGGIAKEQFDEALASLEKNRKVRKMAVKTTFDFDQMLSTREKLTVKNS